MYVHCRLLFGKAKMEREEIVQRIEAAAKALRTSGACAQWLAGADPLTAKVDLD